VSSHTTVIDYLFMIDLFNCYLNVMHLHAIGSDSLHKHANISLIDIRLRVSVRQIFTHSTCVWSLLTLWGLPMNFVCLFTQLTGTSCASWNRTYSHYRILFPASPLLLLHQLTGIFNFTQQMERGGGDYLSLLERTSKVVTLL